MLQRSLPRLRLFSKYSLNSSLYNKSSLPIRYYSSNNQNNDNNDNNNDEYFDVLMKEYPYIASRSFKILKNYNDINKSENPPFIKVDAINPYIKPSFHFGRVIDKSRNFGIAFLNKKNEMIHIDYKGYFIYPGFSTELCLKFGFSFITGLSQILPEIPKYLEIENGWSLSLLFFQLTKFKVYEFPTQTFWIFNLNLGIGLAYQSLHGLLYLNEIHKKTPYTLFWKYSTLAKLIGVFGGLFIIFNGILAYKTKTSLQLSNFTPPNITDDSRIYDLYKIGDAKGKYD